MASAIAACASTSSGLVGSTTQAGSTSVSSRIQVIAPARSQRWLASIAIWTSGPAVSRAIRRRLMSSVRLAPAFSLI